MFHVKHLGTFSCKNTWHKSLHADYPIHQPRGKIRLNFTAPRLKAFSGFSSYRKYKLENFQPGTFTKREAAPVIQMRNTASQTHQLLPDTGDNHDHDLHDQEEQIGASPRNYTQLLDKHGQPNGRRDCAHQQRALYSAQFSHSSARCRRKTAYRQRRKYDLDSVANPFLSGSVS